MIVEKKENELNCENLGDVFCDCLSDEVVVGIMEEAMIEDDHDVYLLTRNVERMATILDGIDTPGNICAGALIDREYNDIEDPWTRIDHLVNIDVQRRLLYFKSCLGDAPLLNRVYPSITDIVIECDNDNPSRCIGSEWMMNFFQCANYLVDLKSIKILAYPEL